MAVYGSGRLGTAAVDAQGEFIESYLYELTDHLGNVRATLKDNYNGNGLLNSYADYYPGGMPMPGGDRTSVSSGDYKFGYQGQFAEKDDETGFNQFEARLYDARIMRWNVPDPAGQFWSPYNGMGNDWINGVDPDGRWRKGGGLLKNIFWSDTRITQEATRRANLGPSSMWCVGTEGGYEHFVVMDGSRGQVLHENPGLFRNLINKHGSSALGQELWMDASNYGREQSSRAVLSGMVNTISAVSGAAGLVSGGFALAANLRNISNVTRIATQTTNYVDDFVSLYSKPTGSIRAPAGGIRVGGTFYKGGQYIPRQRIHYGRGGFSSFNDLPALSTWDAPTPMNLNAHWMLRWGMATGGSGLAYYYGTKNLGN